MSTIPTCIGSNGDYKQNNVCYKGDKVRVDRKLLTDDPVWICGSGENCTCLHGDDCTGEERKIPDTKEPKVSNVIIEKWSEVGCKGKKLLTTRYNAQGSIGDNEISDYTIDGRTLSFGICAATCINGVIYEQDIVGNAGGPSITQNDFTNCRPITNITLPGQEEQLSANIRLSEYAFLPGCHSDYWMVKCEDEKNERNNVLIISLATCGGIIFIIFVYYFYKKFRVS